MQVCLNARLKFVHAGRLFQVGPVTQIKEEGLAPLPQRLQQIRKNEVVLAHLPHGRQSLAKTARRYLIRPFRNDSDKKGVIILTSLLYLVGQRFGRDPSPSPIIWQWEMWFLSY